MMKEAERLNEGKTAPPGLPLFGQCFGSATGERVVDNLGSHMYNDSSVVSVVILK